MRFSASPRGWRRGETRISFEVSTPRSTRSHPMASGLATSDPGVLLVVEDEANLRAALVALVAREGFRTLEASTLDEARKLLSETRLDAVLVDLSLPDGSGLDLIGEATEGAQPEYVVVTGDDSADTAVQALRRGALDYLTKPVDRARLRSVLTN